MRLIPLGTSAGMPSGGVASSGYLVEGDGTRVMLDCGPGTSVGLSRYFADGGLDALFVSHMHTDHILDVLAVGKMVLTTRLRRDESGTLQIDPERDPIPLFVPRGARERLVALAALFPVTTHPLLDRAFDVGATIHEYEPGETVQVGPLSLRFALMHHAEPDCGVRIDGTDGSLTYSGDTGSTPALAELARGTGTLLVESTLRDTDPTPHGHLASSEAGVAAREAGVADLVLTHMSAHDEAAREWHRGRAAAEFAGPVTVAEPFVPHTVALALAR